MIVMKFGGTSLADADRIASVAELVRARLAQRPVVVLSAMAGVTDLLVEAVAAARRGDRDAVDRVVGEMAKRHRWAIAGALHGSSSRHDLELAVDAILEELRLLLRSVRTLGEGTPRAADTLSLLGLVAAAGNRYDEAEAHLTHALELWRRTPPKSQLPVAEALGNLADHAAHCQHRAIRGEGDLAGVGMVKAPDPFWPPRDGAGCRAKVRGRDRMARQGRIDQTTGAPEGGADPGLMDESGLTALDYARRKLARLQSRPTRRPRRSPSLDENDQLRLSPEEQAELEEIRREVDGDPDYLRMWWQERLRAARRVFNDPEQVERIVELLEAAEGQTQ